jgi:hypothetical protein
VPLAQATARDVAEALLPQLARTDYPEHALPDLGGIAKAADALLELVE